MAVIVPENSAEGIRTVTLHIPSPDRFADMNILLLQIREEDFSTKLELSRFRQPLFVIELALRVLDSPRAVFMPRVEGPGYLLIVQLRATALYLTMRGPG